MRLIPLKTLMRHKNSFGASQPLGEDNLVNTSYDVLKHLLRSILPSEHTTTYMHLPATTPLFKLQTPHHARSFRVSTLEELCRMDVYIECNRSR